MKIASAPARITVVNTKGVEFEVSGRYYGNGAILAANPKPDKYPDFAFLYTEPDIFDEDDPKRLYWLKDGESDPGKLSKFRIKSILIVNKLVKKRGTRK